MLVKQHYINAKADQSAFVYPRFKRPCGKGLICDIFENSAMLQQFVSSRNENGIRHFMSDHIAFNWGWNHTLS